MGYFCKNCGTEIDINNAFCGNCGTKINKDDYSDEENGRDTEYKDEEVTNGNNKQNRSTALVIALLVVALVVIVLVAAFFIVYMPLKKYNNAISLKNGGEYEKAIDYFEDLGDFKDSREQIEVCREAIKDEKYKDAVNLMNSGDYYVAIAKFTELDGYKDSNEKIEECIQKINEQQHPDEDDNDKDKADPAVNDPPDEKASDDNDRTGTEPNKEEVQPDEEEEVKEKPVSYSKGLIFEKYRDGYKLVNIGSCSDTTLMIPPTYNGKPVISIGENVFDFHSPPYHNNPYWVGEYKKIVVPEGVEEYTSFMSDCTIDELVLPSTLSYFADDTESMSMTAGISLIHKITIDENNPYYKVVSGCLIEKSTKRVLHISKGCKIPSDGSVTKIDAMFSCEEMSSLKIPEGITDVELCCDGEVTIYLPNSLRNFDFNSFDGIFQCLTVKIVYNGTSAEWMEKVAPSYEDTTDPAEMGICQLICNDTTLYFENEYDW